MVGGEFAQEDKHALRVVKAVHTAEARVSNFPPFYTDILTRCGCSGGLALGHVPFRHFKALKPARRRRKERNKLAKFLPGQPSRRLWTEKDAPGEEEHGRQLDTHGYDPLRGLAVGNSPVRRVVDPEAQHGRGLRDDLEHADEAAADAGRGRLGDVDGHDHGGAADAEPAHGAAGDEQA